MAWNFKLSPHGSWCSLIDFLVSINVTQVCFNQSKPRLPKHSLFSVRKKQKQLSSLVMYMRMVTVSYFRIWVILDGWRQLGWSHHWIWQVQTPLHQCGSHQVSTWCLLESFWHGKKTLYNTPHMTFSTNKTCILSPLLFSLPLLCLRTQPPSCSLFRRQ